MEEFNNADPEVLNTLYEICYPQKKETPYEKGKHSYITIDGEELYLMIKYRNLPYTKAVIERLSKAHIPHRKIDTCLNILANNFNAIFLETYIGTDLATEIYKIKSCFDITFGKVGIENLATIQEYLKEVK